MNQENFEYLERQLKMTGFGEMGSELKEKLHNPAAEFQLVKQMKIVDDEMIAKLYFKKSNNSDRVFFNQFDATLTKSDGAERTRTFYLEKGYGISLKEAYNLLDGRAVEKLELDKEGNKFRPWMELNFSKTDKRGNYEMQRYHPNWGYDLVKALEKHPIKELSNNDSREMLLKSLQKGNRQFATFIEEGKEVKRFIEANPRKRGINIYDRDTNLVLNKTLNQELKKEQKQELKQEKKMEEKQELKPESKKDNLNMNKTDDLEKKAGKKKSRSREMPT